MLRRNLRILAALIVVASAALPFYTCTSYVDEAGKSVEVEPGAALPPGVRAEVEVHRPIESFDLLDSDSYVFMLAFLWPLAFVGIRAAVRRPRALRAILIVELLLMLGSGWIFYATLERRRARLGRGGGVRRPGPLRARLGPRSRGWIRKEA